MNTVCGCGCGKGYASEFDGVCKFCRETLVRRAEARKVGVKHRGDGMTIEQYAKATDQPNILLALLGEPSGRW